MQFEIVMHCDGWFFVGIVSCDNDTYAHSRLRQHHFREVEAKDMKGIRDAGTIREYTEDSSYINFTAQPLIKISKPIIARERF